MNVVLERIYDLMKQKGMTGTALCKAAGISQSTFAMWKKNDRVPKAEYLPAIATALGVSVDYLMMGEAAVRQVPNRIPVYGAVPAGIPLEAITDIQDWEEIPSVMLDEDQYIGLKVQGNSMFPKYQEGDTIIVKVQPDCESGQDAVVYVNGYDATLKKVLKYPDGIMLQPLNPEYEPKMYYFDGEGPVVKILGVVDEIRRKV